MPLLSPATTKYRKPHTLRLKGFSSDTKLAFGETGVITLESGFITDRQIETIRVILSRSLPKGGKYWIRVFPDRSYTKKPLETRMGKGKADIDHWEAAVAKGKVLFEWSGVSLENSRELVHKIACKIGKKVKLITRSDIL